MPSRRSRYKGLLHSAKVHQQAYEFNMKPHHFGISNTTLGSTCSSSIYSLRNKRHGSVYSSDEWYDVGNNQPC
ncbi:hypothetical protein Pmani_017491 [Petrolisthes manimaculis]|uniref:Uncharacterized protein n=1 Tax=Petrolisthes manimaculis TaxID=1843537 RepID=A0AAE1PN96_9EUCA|nr:hypothetical protein Pmani_017491 [Petrolisthes manimaculis]